MRVKKLNSTREVLLNIAKYRINWDTDGSSKPERLFRDLIKPYWKNSIILFQVIIPGSLLRLDFLNVTKKLLVEIDGKQHSEFNKHFHNNSRANYLASIKRDLQKEKWAEDNNIKVLHLNEADLKVFSPQYIKEKFDIDIA